MTVPANLDFARWLGPAPQQPYMEDRVHPQEGYGRPGWITTEDFGLGMITNWGAHHIDIAQWAMGMELSGPSAIEARAEFMKNDVWTVHEAYHAEMLYPNGVQVILDNSYENGLRFEGSEGWVFCARGPARVTTSDPIPPEDPARPSLRASSPQILAPLGDGATRWSPSPNHYLNWLESIAAKRDPIAPVEQAVRSLEACCVAWISMKLGRRLTWDPAKEAFIGDGEANGLRARKPRSAEYDFNAVMKQAGLAGF
jgi:predicted dehydrogenase